MPLGIMPMTTASALGSEPIARAYQTKPAANEKMPAEMTDAAPKFLISLPANSNDVIGTSSRARRDCQTGLQGRPSPRGLFPQSDGQEHRTKGGRIGSRDQRSPRKLPDAEERGIDKRIDRVEATPEKQ